MIIGFLYALLVTISGIYIYQKEEDGSNWFRTFCIFFLVSFICIYVLQYLCTERYYRAERQNYTLSPTNTEIITEDDQCRVLNKNLGLRFIADKSKVNIYTVEKEEDEVIEIIGQYRSYYPANPTLNNLYYMSKEQRVTEYLVERVNISRTREHQHEDIDKR